MKRKRDPLPLSTQVWVYVGATVALVGLMLIGYWLEINLALPAFLAFLLLVTIIGARHERAERRREAQETAGESTESPEKN